MAAAHVQDAVYERRLRPIYDSLEVGNNRKALQETEKLLKKHPSMHCARALKGLALMRLGRYDESHGFLQAVADEKPADDSTLQVLSFCYKELEQLDKIVELYNNAVKKNPGNEELLAHLFISYVRLEDFKSQNVVSMQLYKAQQKNAYYCWAVMSNVLQAVRGPESKVPAKRKIYLALAERMMEKLIKDNKLESEQEVFLYLHILKLQEKFKEALAFLNDAVYEQFYPGAPITTKIELLKKLEMWQEVNVLMKDLLKDEPDRWDYYQDYLDSCFSLLKAKEATKTPASDAAEAAPTEEDISILDECHDYLCQLIEQCTDGKKVRGPYLARLDLYQRMRQQNLNAAEFLGDFCLLITEYFQNFGDKSCCTHDIALFLPMLSVKDRQDLARKLLQQSGISSTVLPQNKEQMQRHICALQISRICGTHLEMENEHLLVYYTALKLHYEHGLSTFGKNLLPTDMGPSDPYALLAANIMYDVSLKQQNSKYLFEALCLLQYVLRNSTSNFHVKLLSLKIYHMFGCLLGAQEMYDYLDIKQIQLDSMGYIHCQLLPLSGRRSTARMLFDSTLKFFTSSYKERLEYIAYAYRFCSFSKLEEFMNFKDRLSNSLHYVAITVEAQLCDLVMLYGSVQQNLATYTAMCIEPADDRISWHELSDNRDLSAIVRWDPVHLVDLAAERKESFDQEVEVLQIRSLMLRLTAAYVDLFVPPPTKSNNERRKSATANDIKSNAINDKHNAEDDDDISSENGLPKETATVELLLDSWQGLFQRLHLMKYAPLSNRFLVNLLPTRLHLLLQEVPYEKFFVDLTSLVLALSTGAQHLKQKCELVNKNVLEIAELCKQTVAQSNAATAQTDGDSLWHRRSWLNKVSACLELLSIYAFLLTVFLDKMQQAVTATAAKTRKDKKSRNSIAAAAVPESTEPNQNLSEKERKQFLLDLMRNCKQSLDICEKAIGTWQPPTLPRDLNSFMADMSLKPEVEATLIGDVASTFKESHELMITEQLSLLKDKKRMLSSK